MTTIRQQFENRLTTLGLTTDDLFNGCVSITLDDGIHLLECQPEGLVDCATEKVYPTFEELRQNEQFFLAAVRYFADHTNRYFLGKLCKWFTGNDKDCPMDTDDLFHIKGDFAKSVITYTAKDKNISITLSRNWLIQSIKDKYEQGYVLDGSRMKGNHISYVFGMFDTIKSEWMPCLVKNNDGDLAVTYFESNDPIQLKNQIHLQAKGGWVINDIVTESLQDIHNAMIIP